MGRINLYELHGDQHVVNTQLHYGFEATEELVEKMIYDLSSDKNISNNEDGRVCYLFVHGSKSRRDFQKLKTVEGIHICWEGFYGPRWLYPLSFIVSGHGGLLKVNEPRSLPRVLGELSELAMITMCSFKSVYENELVLHIKINNWKSNIESFLAQDSSYMRLMIDGDNAESSTGIYVVVACGEYCPNSLVVKANKWNA